MTSSFVGPHPRLAANTRKLDGSRKVDELELLRSSCIHVRESAFISSGVSFLPFSRSLMNSASLGRKSHGKLLNLLNYSAVLPLGCPQSRSLPSRLIALSAKQPN